VYLSGDQSISPDPNLYYFGEGAVVSGLSSAIEVDDRNYEGTYKWAVVGVLDGFGYTPTAGVSLLSEADPNNIIGPVWSFTTQPADRTPIVDAGSSYVTWLGNLPQVLAGTVDDDGEGDIADVDVVWSLIAAPAGSTASLTKTSVDPLLPTASFTTDMAGSYTVQLTAADTALQTGSDTLEIQVAADACEAAPLAGYAYSIYDTNTDCVVNMVDFAAFALQWLSDITLMASEPY
jgi:hypothetical protein